MVSTTSPKLDSHSRCSRFCMWRPLVDPNTATWGLQARESRFRSHPRKQARGRPSTSILIIYARVASYSTARAKTHPHRAQKHRRLRLQVDRFHGGRLYCLLSIFVNICSVRPHTKICAIARIAWKWVGGNCLAGNWRKHAALHLKTKRAFTFKVHLVCPKVFFY
jgi:hypothetical protein